MTELTFLMHMLGLSITAKFGRLSLPDAMLAYSVGATAAQLIKYYV